MKRFRKLRVVVLVVLVIGVISYFCQSDVVTEIEPGSTLVIELEGDYVEASQAPWFAMLLGEVEQPFSGLLSTFAVAARDDRIAHVVIVIRPLSIGWGKAEELRAAIGRLRDAGRHPIAYLDMAAFSGSREYFVASAAEQIYLTPGGSLPILGLAAEYMFLGGLWEKLGVGFEIGQAGKYKSAVESYTAEEMSPAALEMANSLLDSINAIFMEGIMKGRNMTRAQVMAAINRGPMLEDSLREAGLVDHVEYLDAVLADLDGPVVEHATYASVAPEEVGFSAEASVALIYGTGTVVQGWASRNRSGGSVFASRTAAESIHDAAIDPSIDAIILRIDSPGGSALASEQIWRSVEKAREEGKPIIASFSDVAASGGYYVAVAADEIVSNAGVLTGSIGVFAIRPVLGAALSKIGIQMQSLTRGDHADFLVASKPLSESGRERLNSLVLDIYRIFVERVAEGRDLSLEQVDEIAQGRVWTGAQAKEVGLVDRLGGLHEAVEVVRERLGLEPDSDVVLVPFPATRGFAEELTDLLKSRIDPLADSNWPLPEALKPARRWFEQLSLEEPLAIPPLWVELR